MKQETIQLLEKYNLEPKKYLGQNFLIDRKVLDEIIKCSNIKSSDNVLEVGPGLGFLTKELTARAKKVAAIELDKSLFFVLKQEFKETKNLELINDDILKIDFAKLKRLFKEDDYKIIANIPYKITSHFLKKFLTAQYYPHEMVIMVQLEVAERIVAEPGKHSLLSLSVQFYSQPEIIHQVSSDSFLPKPKVSSAIIKLKNIQKNRLPVDEKLFFRLLHIGFSAKRKQLQNNLANGFHAEKSEIKDILLNLGFKEHVRAQELSLKDWHKLYSQLIKQSLLK